MDCCLACLVVPYRELGTSRANSVFRGHPQKSVDLREMFGCHLDTNLIICIFSKIFGI